MSDRDSELISRLIIDKLISNVVIEIKRKNIDLEINNHIEKFVFNMISPFIESAFFYHEKGLDIIEKNKSYYKNNFSKINTWITIPEPDTCLMDRFINRNKVIKPKISNILENVVKEQEENDLKTNKFDSINNENKDNKYKLNKKKKKYDYINNLLKRKILINKAIESNDNKNEKNAKKEPILEIKGIHLPYDKKERIHIILNDTEENNYLRKERKLELIEKEKKLKLEELEKKKTRQKLLFLNKDLKPFNSEQLTFDSNGKILKLNIQNTKLFQKDFISSKINIKNKTENTPPTSDEKNQKKQKMLEIEDNNKEIVEYNNQYFYDFKRDFNNNNDKKKDKDKDDKENIVLSGSNYNMLKPEIGVVISSDDNDKKDKKIGGFDYIKKYNRPSMNELSQFLMSSNNNDKFNSNNKIASFLYSYSNSDVNDKFSYDYNNYNYNYIGYRENFNEDKNPLFQGAFHIKEDNKFSAIKKSLSNENIFRKNKFIKRNLNINNKNFSNNILLSQNFNFPNLKSVFSDAKENYINTDINKAKNKNSKKNEKIKIMKENKSNKIIYSFSDLKNKRILPKINTDKKDDKNYMGQNYINKFLIGTIKRNLSNSDYINDINNENSYKNKFLKLKKLNINKPNKI